MTGHINICVREESPPRQSDTDIATDWPQVRGGADGGGGGGDCRWIMNVCEWFERIVCA